MVVLHGLLTTNKNDHDSIEHFQAYVDVNDCKTFESILSRIVCIEMGIFSVKSRHAINTQTTEFLLMVEDAKLCLILMFYQ